jgi:hypothetical protein
MADAGSAAKAQRAAIREIANSSFNRLIAIAVI